MRHLSFRVAVAVLAFVLGTLTQSFFSGRPHVTNRVEREAFNLTYELFEAIERHDRPALERILADNFAFSLARKYRADAYKATFINVATNPRFTYSLSPHDTAAQTISDRILVSGRLKVKEAAPRGIAGLPFHFVCTYERSGGRLRLVSLEIDRQPTPNPEDTLR